MGKGNAAGMLDPQEWQEFYDGFSEAGKHPELIIAIARKMPRILEYAGILGTSGCQIVTERALPWVSNTLSPNGYAVFCDDILNWGSTLSHYVEFAQRHGMRNVQVRVYAMRETRRGQHRSLFRNGVNLTVSRSFDEGSYWRFETSLPQQLVTMGKPFDIDFPILTIPLSEADACRTTENWLDSLGAIFASVHNLTTPTQRSAGITSISILEPMSVNIQDVVPRYRRRHNPTTKIRLYVSKSERLLRIVPMWIVPIHESILFGDKKVFSSELNSIFAEVSSLALQGEPFPHEPRYNLFTYLLSFSYGQMFLPHIESLISGRHVAQPSIAERDLELLFGRSVSDYLKPRLDALLCAQQPVVGLLEHFPAYEPPSQYLKPDRARKIALELKKRGYLYGTTQSVIRESMRIIDGQVGADRSCDDRHLSYNRLRDGLPLCDLWRLARTVLRKETAPSFEEMSFLLDYYVDLGVVVPMVERIGAYYVRSYRRGEADAVEFMEVVYNLLKRHGELFPDTPLNITFLKKILGAIAIYHPGRLPIMPMFEYRGTVPFMISDDGIGIELEDAIDFLVRKHVMVTGSRRQVDENQLRLLEEGM